MESGPVNTCWATALCSYPSGTLCFLPGGGRDGADGWEDENEEKASEKRERGQRAWSSTVRRGTTLVPHCRVPESNAMSSSRQHSESRAIPTRKVLINDATQLPHDYCTTPGGTLFSTTPGGTRIIYDRKFLLDRRHSPIAQTPPKHLPVIPGVTSQNILNENKKNEANHVNNHDGKPGPGEDAQFEMDI
ncbi:eukaryotic translation initiation factor 4E-binding protein 2 [Hoplias malabaricus]|uniref:eukaryotic translation initiation factor 4E-binding protein 2 n=1 Tax=Hoplias malabaricus TaxID=27720 RepID=UPI003462E4AA